MQASGEVGGGRIVEEDIKILIKAFRDVGNSIEVTKQQLIEKYCLEENVANEKIEMYWEKKDEE